MNNLQSKLNKEQKKIKILTSIWRNPMMNYTADTLAMFCRSTENHILTIIDELIADNLLHCNKGRYFVTDSGLECARISQNSPKFRVNTRQWKEEALTGIYTKGGKSYKSEIDRAVLPKGC